MASTQFEHDFEALTGHAPLPWQTSLFERLVAGNVPNRCDLPTGLGKTSVIVVWLLALACNPGLPRRLAYVVNRRTVVDQATSVCESLATRLRTPDLHGLRARLLAMSATNPDEPLSISTLRGERADNAEWRRDPARPSIVVGTIDMVGSRLLFSGYGCSYRTRPLHAGLLGQDVLLIHDEAHLAPAFQSLLESIMTAQGLCNESRPLRVLAMSATSRDAPDFALGPEDHVHPVVAARLHARKGLSLIGIADRRELAGVMAHAAAASSGRTLVFLSRVDDAERAADLLRKRHGPLRVAVLTGTMRGAERDALARHPVFARFMPTPAEGVAAQPGDVWLVATSAGEVGIDISSEHMLTDLVPFDALSQRLGRVNRYGLDEATVSVYGDVMPAEVLNPTRGSDDETGDVVATQGQYDFARQSTWQLLQKLPIRTDGLRDASPAALRGLSLEDRRHASTPAPAIRPVDGILFDRWSFTTLQGALPGRPPVADWLHGLAEWEPPRTSVAWRREVAWLTEQHLQGEDLGDFLADYPLRSRELLTDRTDRVVKHLARIVGRAPDTRAWLVTERGAEFTTLAGLLQSHDPRKSPLLAGAALVLPPEAGGLAAGLLDAGALFEPGEEALYDLGPRAGERAVIEGKDSDIITPPGMRLVRTLPRNAVSGEEPGEEAESWCLFTPSSTAEEVSSRTSRTRQTLEHHLGRTQYWAERIGESLGLPIETQRVLALAGRWHDIGKRRSVWQASIRNAGGVPLAKGPMRPAELGHYRHELGSLVDLREVPALEHLSPEYRDLALHLVAAHHGRARPAFPEFEAFDPGHPAKTVGDVAAEVPLRFDRMQRRHGRWGLAWLESLIRTADALASEDEQTGEEGL